MLLSICLFLFQVHCTDEVTSMLWGDRARLEAREVVQAAGLSLPPQALSFTWVPLAVPATRIFTMAVTSSRCFLSSSSSTWEAGRDRDRQSLLPKRFNPALHHLLAGDAH